MQHSHCVHFWPVLGMMVLLAGPLSAQSTISKPSGALEDFAQYFVIGESEAQVADTALPQADPASGAQQKAVSGPESQPAVKPQPRLLGRPSAERVDKKASLASPSRWPSWLIQTLGALGVVVALILLLRFFWMRFSGQVGFSGQSQVIEVLSRTAVAPRNHVLLLRLGQRVLVVGDSVAGLRTLAQLDDPQEVAALLTAISAARSNSVSKTFSTLLGRFNHDYSDDIRFGDEGGDDLEHVVDRTGNRLSDLLWRMRRAGQD